MSTLITLCTQDTMSAEVDHPTVAYSGDEPVLEAIPSSAQDPAEVAQATSLVTIKWLPWLIFWSI